MQWHLAGLTDCTAEDQQTYAGRNCNANVCRTCDEGQERGVLQAAGAAVVKEQRAGLRIQPDDAEEKCEVANSRGNKGLLRRRCRTRLLIPEADQQVGGEADDLPTDK